MRVSASIYSFTLPAFLLFQAACGQSLTTIAKEQNNSNLEILKDDLNRSILENQALLSRYQSAQSEYELLTKELTLLDNTISQEEQLLERERLRKHLLSVVEETKRKAAASEEHTARFKNSKVKEARLSVGKHILERAELLCDLLKLFINTGFISEDSMSKVLNDIASARQAQQSADPAAVQEYAERIGATVYRLISEAWNFSEKSKRTDIEADISSVLDKEGIVYSYYEIGFLTQLNDLLINRNMLGKLNSCAFVVLLSFSNKPSASALQKAEKRASDLSEKMISLGVDKERIVYRITDIPYSHFLNIKNLSEKEMLLIVPLPQNQ